MRKYEFTCIVDGSIDDAAAAASLEKYVKIIRDKGGEVTHQESWGRRRLAYEIGKKNEGHYLHVRMKAAPELIAEMNRMLHFDETVIRSLFVIDEEWQRRNEESMRRAEAAAARRAAAPPATS